MNRDLDSYISGIKNLPTTPDVLVKLITLFQKPDREVDEIVALVRQDPSLTAGVLRHSNSVVAGSDEPVVDVFEAVTRIGFSQVYQAVVAKLASQAMQPTQNGSDAYVGKLWRHSATAGVCAGVFARQLLENEGLAFTSGLLHDIGKTVLLSAEGETYTSLIAKVGNSGSALQCAEEIFFGFSHAEIGAHLLSRWGLPEEITLPICQHHRIDWSPPHDRICAIVSLGNIMAHATDVTSPENQYDTKEASYALRILDLDEDHMKAMLEDTSEEINRTTELLCQA